MKCPRCEKRGKTWNGEDPKCAFKTGGFDSDNWNCATMNELRDKFNDNQIWHEDQMGLMAKAFNSGEFLVLSWYKRRGRVEGAWIMDEDKMTSLTLAEAEKILEDGKDRPEK